MILFRRQKSFKTYEGVTVNEIHSKNVEPEKPDAQVVDVPDNSLSKLMYYLHCVRACIDINVSSRLFDFKNYRLLTELEKRDVVAAVHGCRPGLLRNVIFFEVDNDNPLLAVSTQIPNNCFYDLNDSIVSESLHPNYNVICLDGAESVIHRVMVYNDAWIQDNFYTPFVELKWIIGIYPLNKSHQHDRSYGYNSMQAMDVPFWCASGVILCLIFPPVGLALMIVGACRGACEVGMATSNLSKTSVTVSKVVA